VDLRARVRKSAECEPQKFGWDAEALSFITMSNTEAESKSISTRKLRVCLEGQEKDEATEIEVAGDSVSCKINLNIYLLILIFFFSVYASYCELWIFNGTTSRRFRSNYFRRANIEATPEISDVGHKRGLSIYFES
jgi:hypothetical protein